MSLSLVRWEPSRDLVSMQDAMDRFVDRAFKDWFFRPLAPFGLSGDASLTTFAALLSRVSAASASQMNHLVELDEVFDRELDRSLPELKRVASYALLGAADLVHILEAPDAATAAEAALLANRVGVSSTQTLTAISLSEFKDVAQDVTRIQITRS